MTKLDDLLQTVLSGKNCEFMSSADRRYFESIRPQFEIYVQEQIRITLKNKLQETLKKLNND